ALGHRRRGVEGRGRRDVVHGDCRLVLGEAAVLGDYPRADGEAAVVVEGAARRGARAGARVGRAGERAVVARVGVVEAGGRVGARRVALAREGDRRRRALVTRAGGGGGRGGGR